MTRNKNFPHINHPGNSISRRQFLSMISTATAGLLVGKLDQQSAFANITTDGDSKVAVTNMDTYDRSLIRNALENMLDNLGGLNDIIKSGDKVGIKINLTGGSGYAQNYQNQTGLPPGETYWTHPEVLRAICELTKDTGSGPIYLLEGIYDWQSFQNYGYKNVADYIGADFIDLNQKDPYSDYSERSVGENYFIYEKLTQNKIFNNLDCLISLAKSKRHIDAGVTHGIKNLVGTLPVPAGIYNNGQGHRAAIHQFTSHDGNPDSNLCRIILDIHNATPIHLVINDAIKTVLGGEGPWTQTLTLANFNTLIASKDPVAADAIATQAMGFNPMAADLTIPFPDSINYLRVASELGMGNYDLAKIKVIDTPPTVIKTNCISNLPTILDLKNYPNPFNIETTFEFSLSHQGYTSVRIYNQMGQPIRKLLAKSIPAGINRIKWDGRNDCGRFVSSGIYITIIESGGYRKSRRVLLVK